MDIKELGSEIKTLTVADIAIKTEKTERAVKSYLTSQGISCVDYDGEKRRAESREKFAELGRKRGEEAKKRAAEELENRTSNQNASKAMLEIKERNSNAFSSVFIFFGIVWLVLTVWGFGANGAGFFLFWLVLSAGVFMAASMVAMWISENSEKAIKNKMSEKDKKILEEKAEKIREYENNILQNSIANDRFGLPNVNLVCPHCQVKGNVRSKSSEEITKTKVIPIVGNSIKARKNVTQMHCDNCNTTWNV